jgi:hypothetical protein
MVLVFQIIVIANVTVIVIAAITALIHLLTIILVPRFHTVSNILIGNVLVATIVCAFFWIASGLISDFYPALMLQSTFAYIFSSYSQVMINCILVYSIAMISINRFWTIKYPTKRFFKRRAWPFISLIVQWIAAIILPLPIRFFCFQVSFS